jgi:excisionase family DNA binding protein
VDRNTDIHEKPRRRAEVLTAAEAAALLRVSLKSIYKAANNGQLPVLRFGRIIRIPVHALERMLDESAPSGRDNRS